MKKYFFLFFSFVIGLGSLTLPLLSHAATMDAGTLIKGSGSAVYYYVPAQKSRYVFPNEATYATWYKDFSSVQTISDADLAAITIKGNVTMRPGVKLVKITTDPKVYAVSRGGTLRWITNEETAIALYGAAWAKQVRDIPDAFFVNYTVGLPIFKATDFLPDLESVLTPTIGDDRGLPPLPTQPPDTGEQIITTPTSTSSNSTTTDQITYVSRVSASNLTPRAGQIVTLRAEASPVSGVAHISVYFDGALQRTCQSTPCSIDLPIPLSGTKPSYEIKAITDWLNGKSVEAKQALTLSSASRFINLSVTNKEVRPNATQEFIADVNSDFSARFIDIYVDNIGIRGCANLQQCRYTISEPGSIGTVHTVYATAQDANGTKIQSPTSTYAVVANDHPQISFNMGKTAIYVNEKTDIRAEAMDADSIAWTELWVDGALVKHCLSSSCSSDLGPWSSSRSVEVVARSQDLTGLMGFATSTPIMVQ